MFPTSSTVGGDGSSRPSTAYLGTMTSTSDKSIYSLNVWCKFHVKVKQRNFVVEVYHDAHTNKDEIYDDPTDEEDYVSLYWLKLTLYNIYWRLML